MNIIDTSTNNIANKVHSNTLNGVDFVHFMAFTPIMDAPHPSWALGQQQTDLLQVPTHTAKVKDHGILHLTAGTGLQCFGLCLHPGKRMLYDRSDPAQFAISPVLTSTQRSVSIRLVLNAVVPPKLPGHLLDAVIGIPFVTKQGLAVHIRQSLGVVTVVLVGRSKDAFVDQLALHVHANMAFIAKVIAISFLRRSCLGVVLSIGLYVFALLFLLFHRPISRFNHSSIDDGALAHKQAFFTQLPVNFFKHSIGQPGLGQFILEVLEAGEIRGLIGHRQSNKNCWKDKRSLSNSSSCGSLNP